MKTYTKLNMFWGVIPGLTESFSDMEEMFATAAEIAVSKGLAQKSQHIVITAGVPMGITGSTNVVRVYEI
jgi:pyruvate kinase